MNKMNRKMRLVFKAGFTWNNIFEDVIFTQKFSDCPGFSRQGIFLGQMAKNATM